MIDAENKLIKSQDTDKASWFDVPYDKQVLKANLHLSYAPYDTQAYTSRMCRTRSKCFTVKANLHLSYTSLQTACGSGDVVCTPPPHAHQLAGNVGVLATGAQYYGGVCVRACVHMLTTGAQYGRIMCVRACVYAAGLSSALVARQTPSTPPALQTAKGRRSESGQSPKHQNLHPHAKEARCCAARATPPTVSSIMPPPLGFTRSVAVARFGLHFILTC